MSTYHAYAARLVADHALREALEPSLRLITPAVAWQIAARVVAAYSGPMDAIDRAPQWVTAAVLDLAAELAEHLRTPADVHADRPVAGHACQTIPGRVPALVRKISECQRTREQLLPLVAAYAQAKAAREVIDYGDQVALAARIASRHPQVGAIERARYQVVLLDEYQDTSHAQLVLLQALFGGGHPVTAVGDPCQSIYGWRGASAGNLRRFVADFPRAAGAPGPGQAAVHQLPQHRARAGRRRRPAAGLRAEAPQVPRLVPPPRPGRAGTGGLRPAGHRGGRGGLGRVTDRRAAGPAARHGPGRRPWPDHGSARLRPADIAVLCRKRSQFPLLRAAIEARGIPVEVVGLGGLLTVPEVADVVATLRVLHDPSASSSLARLLTGPRWRIGPRDLVALGRRARDLIREHRAAGSARSATRTATRRHPEPAGPGWRRPRNPAPRHWPRHRPRTCRPEGAGPGPATVAAGPAGPEGQAAQRGRAPGKRSA